MRRVLTSCSFLALILLLIGPFATHSDAHATYAQPSVGTMQLVEGFAVRFVSVLRAREAGLADYSAGKGNVFLLVTVDIRRQGSHASFLADPADFHIQTSKGDIIDSDEFGVANELKARHVYSKPLVGVIGFEVPAGDRNLHLLWQPNFETNPDAQADWLVGASGNTVQYFK